MLTRAYTTMRSTTPIHNGVYFVGDRQIAPVQISTCRTVNFSTNPELVLYSDAISHCVALVIQHGSIVTMAHFFPSNTRAVQLTQSNIEKAILNFTQGGGQLDQHTTFTLYGGATLDEQAYEDCPKGIMEKVLTDALRLNHISDAPSFNENDDGIEVFITRHGTDVLKSRSYDEGKYRMELITPGASGLSFSFMSELLGHMPPTYNRFAESWGNTLTNTEEALPLFTMHDALNMPFEDLFPQPVVKQDSPHML